MNTVYLFSIAGAKLLLNKSLLSRMQISNRETPPREIMHIHYVGVLLLAAFNGVLGCQKQLERERKLNYQRKNDRH